MRAPMRLLLAAAVALAALVRLRGARPPPPPARCVLLSTLCPHGANGPANGYMSLFHLAALARNFNALDVELDGRPAAPRCGQVRVALPRMCHAGNWTTPNTDAGALFDLRVGSIDDGWERGAPLWIEESGALAALGDRGVPCLLDGRYLRRRFLPLRANSTRASRYNGRTANYSSDVFGGTFRCEKYLAAGYERLLGDPTRTEPRSPTIGSSIASGGDGTLFIGLPVPLHLFFRGESARFARTKAVREDIRFHPWLFDTARELLVRSAGLDGRKPIPWASPARMPSFTALLSRLVEDPDRQAAAGIAAASLAQLAAVHDCLIPAAGPTPTVPPFAAAQFRTGDLSVLCAGIWATPAERDQPCGANLSALDPVASEIRGLDVPLVVATDGGDDVRARISAALPVAAFLDPWLPAACPASSAIAYVLRGLLTQLALSCASRVRWTLASTFSRMIAEMAEDGECGGTGGTAEPLPGNLPDAPAHGVAQQ